MFFKINEVFKILIIVATLTISVFSIGKINIENNLDYVASVFFKQSITTNELVQKFEKTDSRTFININKKNIKKEDKIKIMIVPGHDGNNSGAVFNGTKEADLNLKLAKKINSILEVQEEFDVHLSRDDNGYNPKLKKFLENEEGILNFRKEKVEIMEDLIKKEKVSSYVNVQHNFAPSEVVTILYGINKYSNDNNFDIVLHIHFNDYPGRSGTSGKYSGFSIYVPEKQYSNSEASYEFANSLKKQLELFLPISNLPKESAITESQELIAIGSYNTSDAISVLVEYGYIYESQFHNELIQEEFFDEMAVQTYWGIRNYLKEQKVKKEIFSNLRDYKFNKKLNKGDKGVDVLALQVFLNSRGHYPPEGESMNNCPMTGFFGNCTKKSLQEYQRNNKIKESGILDSDTINTIKPDYLFDMI